LLGSLSGIRAQTSSVANWRYAAFVRRLDEAAAPGRGECGPCPDFTLNTLAFGLRLRQITENFSQCNRNALGCSAPNAIYLVDLVIVGDGLDWPAVPCRPWLSLQATGSTLGQLKYLPICLTMGSPQIATMSQSCRSGLWCGRQTAERPDPRASDCYLRIRRHEI